MIINCPACGVRHIDEGEFAVKPHHTHACQFCGMVWRMALVDTVGVEFLPGFHDDKRACDHPEEMRLHGGYHGTIIPRFPLLHGSAEVEMCTACDMWRLSVHAPNEWRTGNYLVARNEAEEEGGYQ